MEGIGQGPKVVFSLPIFGGIDITETIVVGWIIIIGVLCACLYLTKDMKKVPEKKRQVLAEMLVGFINNTVETTMGKKWMFFAPYVGTILIYAVIGSLISLLGLRSMTADFNVTLTWALLTFILITFFKIKTHGPLGYLKSFAQPMALMTPLNLLSEVSTPLSMAFRMFGNIAGGGVITALLYGGLAFVSRKLHVAFTLGPLTINLAQIFTPAVLSIYFDLFTGCIQAYIFVMLTMVYVSNAAEKD
ncbi:MAG: F0F1 ATP synthase subunit A [Oscillospiraceae bacterium]